MQNYVRKFTALALFLLLIKLYWTSRRQRFNDSNNNNNNNNVVTKIKSVLRGKKQGHRLALVVPFIGSDFPRYFDVFCQTAGGSASVMDVYIFHNNVQHAAGNYSLPDNVKLINLETTGALANLLLRVQQNPDNTTIESKFTREQFLQILIHWLETYPYSLVEFKIATGHIFKDYLEKYSHWGYTDLDVAWGDLGNWISRDEWEDYDIVTYTFGDQDRAYLRGQFTFHKNVPRVNQLWRECTYLSNLEDRLYRVLSQKKHLTLESAEGCYSKVVLQRSDISVKYAVKAWTDITKNDPTQKYGIFVSQSHEKTVLYKAGKFDDSNILYQNLMELSPTWYEETNNGGFEYKSPLQWQNEHTSQTPIHSYHYANKSSDANCMYWAPQIYQPYICISDSVSNKDTVILKNGQLYKQPFDNLVFPNHVDSAALYHFQEWKRTYHSVNAFATIFHSNRWVLTKFGAVPLLSEKWDTHSNPQKSANAYKDRSYCFQTGFDEKKASPYCAWWVSWKDVTILHKPDVGIKDLHSDVTLALTLQITAEQVADNDVYTSLLDLAESNIKIWSKTNHQPCILLIHVASATDKIIENMLSRWENKPYLKHVVVGAIFSENEKVMISRKAMMNMVSDKSRTRWTITGLELERGLLLSEEFTFFCLRAAMIYGEISTGNVFVIPQIAALWEMNKERNVGDDEKSKDNFLPTSIISLLQDYQEEIDYSYNLSPFDCIKCDELFEEKHEHVENQIDQLWRELTRSELINGVTDLNDHSAELLSQALFGVQKEFSDLLSSERLQDFDKSLILMVDNYGPKPGMWTKDLVREVEEFAGWQCNNALRISQLATYGYRISALSGAFAMSTIKSRSICPKDPHGVTHGSSRCDGCFMVEDEKALNKIIHAEVMRPIKSKELWLQMKEANTNNNKVD